MRFDELVSTSRAVGETSARLGKIQRLAALLTRVAPAEVEIAVAFLSGTLRQGRIGVGARLLWALRDTAPAESPMLSLSEVDEAFGRVAAAAGAGSSSARSQILRELLGRATRGEQDFILRLIAGELRQGALEGVLVEAVARAAGVPSARVRRAAMLAGDLAPVARAALVEGEAALDAFLIQLFQPVQPMLAHSADSVAAAVTELGESSLEYKLDVEALRRELPLTPVFFDAIYLDGGSLLDEPLSTRLSAVAPIVSPSSLVPRIVTAQPEEAAAFLERAITAGHEGVVAKSLGGLYAAGRRGREWIKVKPARTLDLVVLAAEWGHGRRRGTLSNLHLGARADDGTGFVMLGKTFKGMTDAMLAWQTKKLLELEVARDDYTVHVRPELVVEIAFNELQESPQYPGGVALRFARVKRYREDKSAQEADTLSTVQGVRS
jgi:DNA ligase 1